MSFGIARLRSIERISQVSANACVLQNININVKANNTCNFFMIKNYNIHARILGGIMKNKFPLVKRITGILYPDENFRDWSIHKLSEIWGEPEISSTRRIIITR